MYAYHELIYDLIRIDVFQKEMSFFSIGNSCLGQNIYCIKAGTGAKNASDKQTCSACNGTGEVRNVQRTPLGQFVNVTTCSKCRGTGSIITNPCQTCKGKGMVKKAKVLDVDIPAGINHGQTVILRGAGNKGTNGGPSGDLLVTVSIARHEAFTRDGYDVHLTVPITFVQASLGADIEIPVLDAEKKYTLGKMNYTIAEGTQPGSTIRLRGKGIPVVHSSARGDMILTIQVEVHKNLNNEQKQTLKKFAWRLGVYYPYGMGSENLCLKSNL